MASCNYIPQIMLNNVFYKQQTIKKIGSTHLDECSGKLIEGTKALKF